MSELINRIMRIANTLCIAIALFLPSSLVFADDSLPESIVGYILGETLRFNPNPLNIQSELFGDWALEAVASGLAFHQSNPTGSNLSNHVGVSNLQVDIQKKNGPLKVYIQAGSYAIPTLGQAYLQANKNTESSFGYIPEAYFALSMGNDWSLALGKIPSMGGVEATFSYQNSNIQRGLLWIQTNSVSSGVQLNYQEGNLSAALTVNDGSYSGVYNWVGGLVSIKTSADSAFTASWTGAVTANPTNTDKTPLLQNNAQISNLIYQYTGDRWTVTPYAQYTYTPLNPSIGIYGSTGTLGAAILTTYHVDPLVNGVAPNRHISIPTRVEYQSSFGNSNNANLPAGLMYGPGSSAFSATMTPTIQSGRFFARTEFSYVKVFNGLAGSIFGPSGIINSQFRIMLETGIMY